MGAADDQSAEEQLTIDIDRSDGVPVVRVLGELDLVSVGRLRAVLDELLLGSGPVIVDLRELAFIDSAGLGALVRAHKKARVLRGSVTCLCLPNSQVAGLFRITGLHRVLRVAATVEEARALPVPEAPGGDRR
ncbi:hypothetical protein JCM18899A_05420 [Nocardioides sp. AN3]